MMETAIAEVTNVIEQSLNNNLLPSVVSVLIICVAIGIPILLLKKIIKSLLNFFFK